MNFSKKQFTTLAGFMLLVALATVLLRQSAIPRLLAAPAPNAPPAAPKSATAALPGGYGFAVSVRQFGAVGNGKHNDTAAIQKAIDFAGFHHSQWNAYGVAPERVVFPPGHYRITAPLKLGPADTDMELCGAAGTGGWTDPVFDPTGAPPAGVSSLIWDGPKGGTMLQVVGSGGIKISDLAFLGEGKAGKGITINSPAAYGFGNGMFSRLTFSHMTDGIVCGTHSYICSGDISLLDTTFQSCHTGFLTLSDQNLDYLFLRCTAVACDTALHFYKGGSVDGQLFTTYNVHTVVRIDHGGINAGTYCFDSMRVDGDGTHFRTVVLRAKGETNVNFTSLDLIISGVHRFPNVPAFILGPTANVSVNASMITGRVAVLTGAKKGPPTWIQFNNCRFRQNPLPQIKCDAYSGYALSNCVAGYKMIHSVHHYAR